MMLSTDDFTTAIAAHSAWKGRLKKAIDTGVLDAPIVTIRADDQCPFGKWLHGQNLTAAERASDHYKKVLAAHAEFHQMAARVAELATTGHKPEALELISPVGAYTQVSAKVVLAMSEWKKQLG